MRIDEAIEIVKEYYELARQAKTRNGETIIHDPVDWELYQIWNSAVIDSRKRFADGKNNQE